MNAQGRLFTLFTIYMGKPVGLVNGKQNAVLKISLPNRVYHLHKFISFTDNCRENKTKQNKVFFHNN